MEAPTTQTTGLDRYTGEWTLAEAAHLLRRTTFGPTWEEIKTAHAWGLDALVQRLLEYPPLPNPPLNANFAEDPYVPVGSTWVEAPYVAGKNLERYRNQSLAAWTLELSFKEKYAIREKMTLFWYNHFAIHNINDPKYLYKHATLLRENALGNFKQLVKDVTVDPAMLRFLNGNQNTLRAPNENYARELLELYTVGKGPQVAQGDYSNYTEEDVLAIAKVLTGWRDIGYRTLNPEVHIQSVFVANRHDTSTKQLSHRFNRASIPNMGEREYAYLIDVIFEQKEVARFICRKLYRWFIYYVIDDSIEANVIEPLAELLIAQDFELQEVVRTLLSSEHFFDRLNRGPMIKHPLDFIIGLLRQFEVQQSPNPGPNQAVLFQLYNIASSMDMNYYNPPSVSGWKAWHQEPGYYRFWINGTTLPIRENFSDALATTGLRFAGHLLRIDALDFLDKMDQPADVNALIESCILMLLPQDLQAEQKAALKDLLVGGLPDFVWNNEYVAYKTEPGNTNAAALVEGKFRNFLKTLLSMAEYYLS
jgi:uncharacterized protein (DUF1800 family)